MITCCDWIFLTENGGGSEERGAIVKKTGGSYDGAKELDAPYSEAARFRKERLHVGRCQAGKDARSRILRHTLLRLRDRHSRFIISPSAPLRFSPLSCVPSNVEDKYDRSFIHSFAGRWRPRVLLRFFSIYLFVSNVGRKMHSFLDRLAPGTLIKL